MTSEKLLTEKYLVENPEHSDYLRKANRRKLSLTSIRRAVVRWGVILGLTVASLWFVAHLGGLTSQAQYNGIRLGTMMKSMLSSLNQEQRIWDTVDSM